MGIGHPHFQKLIVKLMAYRYKKYHQSALLLDNLTGPLSKSTILSPTSYIHHFVETSLNYIIDYVILLQ